MIMEPRYSFPAGDFVSITEGVDAGLLESLYGDPYVARGTRGGPIDHPLVTYLSAWTGVEFAGAFMVVKLTNIEFELHSFLRKSAVFYSRELGKKFIAWAFSHPIERITVNIIGGLDSVKNYALKLGFKLEGCRRNACLQCGILKDVYVLGMTREDWRLAWGS